MEWGANAMTLDAVAKQAGVSKGGLLYHFPSKEALVEAMISHLIDDFDAAIQAEIAREISEGKASTMGRWLRAYVRVNTTPQDETEAISCSLMVAFAANPKMLKPAQQAFERWQQQAENDGISAEVATIVRLAADGCWLCRLFGFRAGLDSKEQLPALRRELLTLIDEAVEGSQTKIKGE